MLLRLRPEQRTKVFQIAINKVAAKAVAEINRAIPQEFAVRPARYAMQ